MLTLISFIVMMIGSLNWFCIGLLQFDFVAGLFGSQSSIFSRIVYVLVGVSSLIIAYNLIKNRGRILFDFNKKKTGSKNVKSKPAMANIEAGEDLKGPEKVKPVDLNENHNTEAQNTPITNKQNQNSNEHHINDENYME